jgi:hypothetical protein
MEGEPTVSRRILLIGGALVIGAAVAWYLFRPELLFIDARVSEAFPAEKTDSATDPQESVLAEGVFHSVAHESEGVAAVHQLANGNRLLRLTRFKTSNGPALHVYLVAVKDANDSRTVKDADTVDLGVLKGNKGDQNFELPAGVDLAKYQAVTIWCQRFSVNFATAPLTARRGYRPRG